MPRHAEKQPYGIVREALQQYLFDFDGKPLEDVMTLFERRYGITFGSKSALRTAISAHIGSALCICEANTIKIQAADRNDWDLRIAQDKSSAKMQPAAGSHERKSSKHPKAEDPFRGRNHLRPPKRLRDSN